jgi:hypothetical protein
MNIIDAMNDDAVFGRHFRTDTWDAWRAFLAALFALPMTPEQLAIFQKCTNRNTPSTTPLQEAWLCIGRRGGKSFVLAVIAVFLACFRDWREYLGPGERATVMIVAADRRQARVIMRYCRGLLKAVPMLEQVIESETREGIDLRNKITIEVHTASFRSTRGYTIVAALLDELAYWPTDESASSPDVEVVNAIRPSMATIPGAMLLCASSPHSRRGALWEAHRKHHGKDGDPILVWQADTRRMNPSVPQSLIDQHLADDPARAGAEWLAQFRTDVEGFVSREVVEGCITPFERERPPLPGIYYHAFVDPSGGSADSFTLCVSHVDAERVIIDAIREIRPPFAPTVAVAELVQTLTAYNISSITGDRYASTWPVEAFAKHGIHYDAAAEPKSTLYINFLPLLNSGRVDLLDNPHLINQLVGLERHTARSGREGIDHGPGMPDDVATAVAGAAVLAIDKNGYDYTLQWITGPDRDAGVVDVPSRPKRLHPNLTDEAFLRIRAPVALTPRETRSENAAAAAIVI